MNPRQFSQLLGEIDARYIEEALSYVPPSRRFLPFRRLAAVLAAAILALCLLGAGAAAGLYGDSIQDWFAHCWQAITGQPMSEGQAAVIDHLSQQIGASHTEGEVTVTVDSATVGDDAFFLLLRVEGPYFSSRHSYNFCMGRLETDPDPLESGAFVGWGSDYLGVDREGAALLLIKYEYLGADGFAGDTTPLQVRLHLQDLARDPHTDREKVIAPGDWDFSFSIDRSQPPQAVSMPDTRVMATDTARQQKVPVTLTHMELTNTGLRFQFASSREDLSLTDQPIALLLDSGRTVANAGGIGSPTADNRTICFSCQWLVPVDLEEVAALLIGDTQISLPPD